ncbi:SpoIIAA family protein [Nocardiopsis ganjiahuensis]|uniref:STAS/SEC14 domain-containing protein n=1 Tax=Nocardiopsis ganjiahuensis TaxID=239984 RepID=UPI000347D329|nr:STAS/SEC14 domain-containing protein [Nocardiopsis ganjiahuensis]
MYERLEPSHENVLGFEVGGTVSEDSFRELLAEVRPAIDQYQAVRLLIRIRDWPTTENPTLGERLRLAREHFPGIERYALVGDARAIGSLTSVADAFVDMDLRFFELDQEDSAWAWVNASGVLDEDPG